MFRRLSMHGHSRAGAHAIGGLALLAAVAILVFVPPHLSLSAAGAAFFVVLANLIVDLLYAVLDPRVRLY